MQSKVFVMDALSPSPRLSIILFIFPPKMM